MPKMHRNNGKCEGCKALFERYPGFSLPVRMWFEALQEAHPEAHISEAGRGKQRQDYLFLQGLTQAKFGKSAHNYNAAIDVFCNTENNEYSLDSEWFDLVIRPRLNDALQWYGDIGSEFYERPHIEFKDWRVLAEKGFLHLVSSEDKTTSST